MHDEQHDKPDTEVHHGVARGGDGDNLAREVHLFHQVLVFDQRVGGACERRRRELPENEPAQQLDRVGPFAGGNGHAPRKNEGENEREHKHERQRLDNGPEEAHHRVAVPHPQVFGHKVTQQLPRTH